MKRLVAHRRGAFARVHAAFHDSDDDVFLTASCGNGGWRPRNIGESATTGGMELAAILGLRASKRWPGR